MNAPTVNPSPTIPRTSSSATADSATSGMTQRIDEFIKSKFAAAKSADFSGLKSTATRASALGFGSSANSRYVEFLEAFRSTPALAEQYAESYPASCFLPWPAFHLTIKTLGLWCELPEFYAGVVPDEQLPWMEIFELQQADEFTYNELDLLLPELSQRTLGAMQCAHAMWSGGIIPAWLRSADIAAAERIDPVMRRLLLQMMQEARYGFLVLAPPAAFTTTEDWLSRYRKLGAEVETRTTQAPQDPLVVRLCRGGALVVAAWGDEGAWLNDAVNDLEKHKTGKPTK